MEYTEMKIVYIKMGARFKSKTQPTIIKAKSEDHYKLDTMLVNKDEFYFIVASIEYDYLTKEKTYYLENIGYSNVLNKRNVKLEEFKTGLCVVRDSEVINAIRESNNYI